MCTENWLLTNESEKVATNSAIMGTNVCLAATFVFLGAEHFRCVTSIFSP